MATTAWGEHSKWEILKQNYFWSVSIIRSLHPSVCEMVTFSNWMLQHFPTWKIKQVIWWLLGYCECAIISILLSSYLGHGCKNLLLHIPHFFLLWELQTLLRPDVRYPDLYEHQVGLGVRLPRLGLVPGSDHHPLLHDGAGAGDAYWVIQVKQLFNISVSARGRSDLGSQADIVQWPTPTGPETKIIIILNAK